MDIQWKIENMELKPSVDSLNDVVCTAHWRVYGREEDLVTSVYGSVSFNTNIEPENFLPYEELTEQQVVGWVKDYMGTEHVEALETALASQIENLKNPPVVTKPLPWSV